MKIAKNLLENKTCNNCKFREHEQGDVFFCGIDSTNCYEGTKPLPKENTCERWEEIDFPYVNVSWTKQSIVDISNMFNKDTEKELIETVAKELKNNIDQSIFPI